MADGENAAVMEGFLCPICKADLGTYGRLVTHFQDAHSEEQDLLKSFKDLLGKAKKRILKLEEGSDSAPSVRRLFSPQESFHWDPQEFGASTSHMRFFEAARNARLEMYTVNKNRLIIRLDKLLQNIPTDPVKKKAHEQKMVPWLDGKAVTRCPDCTASFHTAPKFTRQHHCRLCGSVMCNDCSNFLRISTARKILDKPEDEDNSGDQTLRICTHCLKVLETREQIREAHNCKPIICQFYERLMSYRAEADENATVYNKMVSSLCCGETEYSLTDAQALRMNILKQAEKIDALSQKIAVLGTKDTETPPSGQAFRLNKSIRSATTAYLRSQLLNLPILPTESELKHAQFKRRQEMEAKIKEEKMQDARLRSPGSRPEPVTYSPQHKPTVEPQAVSVGQGWVPEKKQFYDLDDPLILQMNIIKNYIQEAKAAHKFDEVSSLEANLQELNEEYWRQQQELDKIREEELLTNSTDSTQDSIEKESSNSNDTQSEQLLTSSSS
ncbi:rabenosyn-5 [Lycorma delicatula]|uniref:rabenosyn-5 n=1 Tax=Lycorma delicatula TaxID=130591 RepID=UPI003F5144BF